MNEDDDLVNEFLIESSENLARLDQEMVLLEQRPRDGELLASIFRTIHTIKGTCGFLGFTILESVTHLAESLLSQVRNGERDLTPDLVTLVLETVDATRRVMAVIESSGGEGDDHFAALRSKLQAAIERKTEAANAASAPETAADLVEPEAARSAAADSTIRVDVGLLDRLMNLVGELVLARNQILQFTVRQEDATFNATSQRLNLITTELQEGVMKTRMQPIGMVWNKLPRVVRDLANACGKQIALEMDGAGTELDKTIIEAIKDPLTHIVRNSCDHGVERPDARVRAGKSPQGRLMLRAFHEGGHVNIEIADDGGGIDAENVKAKAVQKGLIRPEQAERMGEREAFNLIFLPGFSTAEQVSNLSGRGVGMDVVKTNIEKIGGSVDLASRHGDGTTVKIKIPLTLAIIPGLVVRSAGERFVIPQVSLLELIRLEGEEGRRQIESIHGTPVYRRRGTLLPIVSLRDVLKLGGNEAEREVVNVVVLQAEERQFGLIVDEINDTQEIVVKPLGKQFKGLSCYAGATIMGDGHVALILDVMGIATQSRVVAEGRGGRAETEAGDPRRSRTETLLLFSSGAFERIATPLALVSRLEEIPQSKIERAAGRRVVQYRGRVLPLVSLAGLLDPAAADRSLDCDPAQVVVFADGDRQVGVVVDRIVDIVEDEVAVKNPASRRGLIGSGVVNRKMTDFLDLRAVLSAAESSWFGLSQGRPAETVLIADPSPFQRGLLENELGMAGYRVIAVSSRREAVDAAVREGAGTVLAAAALGDAASIAGEIHRHPGGASVRVLPLVPGGENSVGRLLEAVAAQEPQPEEEAACL